MRMPSAERRERRRAGAVLLEAIIAMAILGIAGAAAAELVVQSSAAIASAERADREMRQASAFLADVALWPREDLDRHLGSRAEGAWRLRIDRPWPTLYTATLTDSTSGALLVSTALYRPEPRP